MNLRRVLLALAIGGAAGWGAAQAGVPLPWMIGPLVVVTIAALSRAPVGSPQPIRGVVIPAIGVMLGSSITPEVLAAALHWWVSLVLLVPLLIGQGLLSYAIYRRIGHADLVTGYFCAMPGGLNDMVVMGAAMGGQESRIALAHASRILVVILSVVLLFGWGMGVTTGGAGVRWTSVAALSGFDWLVLTGCGVVGALVARDIPAGAILGPMVLSGLVHATELVTVPPPSVIVNGAQVVIGTVLGCRFVGAAWTQVGRDLWVGALAALAMLGVTFAFSALVHSLTAMPLSQVFLAYSPGGLAEMSLLSFAMGQEVAYVSVTHITRIVLVIALAAPVYAWLRRRA